MNDATAVSQHGTHAAINLDEIGKVGQHQYSIADIAKAYGLTSRTIRFWCHRGLLETISEVGETRMFDAANVKRIATIIEFQNAGFSLAQIFYALELKNPLEFLTVEVVEQRWAGIKEEIAQADAKLIAMRSLVERSCAKR